MPQHFIVELVLNEIKKIPSYNDAKILDLSCGEGEILTELQVLGCKYLHGSRYVLNDYIIKDDRLTEDTSSKIMVNNTVDLTKPLPYDSEQFDIIILTEVIEHLESFRSVLYEAGRILRKNGTLILSTPNINRLHSRWNFFLFGDHKVINRRLGWDLKKEDLYAYHISPVDFQYLHTLLYQAHIKINSMRTTRVKYRHFIWFVFYPFFFVLSLFYYRKGEAGSLRNEGEKDIIKYMRSFAMLYSEQIFIVARKQ
jgi:SAM-dependent methyltransferase